jgi:hypothetical protein
MEVRWFVQTALPEYTMCYDTALRLPEQDRKTLHGTGKLIMIKPSTQKGEETIMSYRRFLEAFDARK